MTQGIVKNATWTLAGALAALLAAIYVPSVTDAIGVAGAWTFDVPGHWQVAKDMFAEPCDPVYESCPIPEPWSWRADFFVPMASATMLCGYALFGLLALITLLHLATEGVWRLAGETPEERRARWARWDRDMDDAANGVTREERAACDKAARASALGRPHPQQETT